MDRSTAWKLLRVLGRWSIHAIAIYIAYRLMITSPRLSGYEASFGSFIYPAIFQLFLFGSTTLLLFWSCRRPPMLVPPIHALLLVDGLYLVWYAAFSRS